MDPVRVTLVAGISPATTSPGGIRSYVLGLAKYLTGAGHQVSLVGVGPPVSGANYDFIPARPDSTTTSIAFHRALRGLHRHRPLPGDVLHCQRPDDLAALRPPDGQAAVLTIHGDPLPGIRRRHGRFTAAAYQRLERHGIQAAARVLFPDSTCRVAFRERYPAEEPKFRDSDVGVDLDLFRPGDRNAARARWNLGPGPHVLFAGRFEEEKNLPSLARALSMSESKPTLLLAGSGTGAPRLLRDLFGVPHRFLGVVPYEEMPSVYSAVDATVIPSFREAMPLACLESLACETPVVATPVGRLLDLIKTGTTGAFGGPAAESLAPAIDLVVRDGASMRSSCRASVSRFGWRELGPKLVSVYREIS